ncbi:MAG: hypothetical protein K6E40_10015 [Desulfovibrio sp.]|nr:hypothetical protein [Desulfovibrio sp.]
MTVLECLQKFREEAEPILARNGRVSLAVEAEGLACLDGMGTEMDAGPRRLSMAEAERIAAGLEGWTPDPMPDGCFISCTGPAGKDGVSQSISFRRVLAFPARTYWLRPDGEIESSDGINRRLALDPGALGEGVSEFGRDEMADLLSWHAVRYGWGDVARIAIAWDDAQAVADYARSFVLGWFRKLGFRPYLDDAEAIVARMRERIAERLAGDAAEPARIPTRKPVSWPDKLAGLKENPGACALRRLEDMAQDGFCLALVSPWNPEDAGLRAGGEASGLAGKVAAVLLGRQEILFRFKKDGRDEEDWLLAVWDSLPEGVCPAPKTFVRLAEFAEAAGRMYGQDAVLLAARGKAWLQDLKRGKRRLLGPFGPASVEAFFRALGRKSAVPMDAGEVRKAGEMSELTPSQRMMGDFFRKKLDSCIEEGLSFWDALHDRTVRRPWAKDRKEEKGRAARPAPRPAALQLGDKVIVQLPLPEGGFRTMRGIVAEEPRPFEGCVRVRTGEGATAKMGTYSESCVHPAEDAFLCAEES